MRCMKLWCDCVCVVVVLSKDRDLSPTAKAATFTDAFRKLGLLAFYTRSFLRARVGNSNK